VSEEKARLFVALELPGQVRYALARWSRDAPAAGAGLRALTADALHVTLCFLGWRALSNAARIADLALACARPVPDLATREAAWLPPRRPRVLAIDLEDPGGALTGMQACVSRALAGGIGYEPERRPFRPHVTVARVARGGRPPADVPPVPRLAFAGVALTLFRSHLRSEGARYEPLARAELPAP
jgi:2'-5' RNA ligase